MEPHGAEERIAAAGHHLEGTKRSRSARNYRGAQIRNEARRFATRGRVPRKARRRIRKGSAGTSASESSACGICHGADLKGWARPGLPPIAQLPGAADAKTCSRGTEGQWTELMKRWSEGEREDMLTIAATRLARAVLVGGHQGCPLGVDLVARRDMNHQTSRRFFGAAAVSRLSVLELRQPSRHRARALGPNWGGYYSCRFRRAKAWK